MCGGGVSEPPPQNKVVPVNTPTNVQPPIQLAVVTTQPGSLGIPGGQLPQANQPMVMGMSGSQGMNQGMQNMNNGMNQGMQNMNN
eukprot:gene41374-50490_t